MRAATASGAEPEMGYPELARILRRVGITQDDVNQRDAHELFRRMVFNILVDNTDDHEKNHSLLVVNPLANGRLTDRADGEHLIALRKEAAARRTTIDALALSAALSQPWVDVVLSGAVTHGQLESNLKSIAFVREPADWPAITESPTEYWARRSALAWQ